MDNPQAYQTPAEGVTPIEVPGLTQTSQRASLRQTRTLLLLNLASLKQLNDQHSLVRSRELSLAITHIENGLLWLEKCVDD